MAQDTLVKTTHYKHPIAAVWHAITDAAEISTWFIQADFKPEVGYRYTFTHNETVITGEVMEVSPVHTLIYTWEIQGTNVPTTVKWSLKEENGGTSLTIEHSGISKYPTEEMAVTMLNNYSSGWDNCTTDLGKHLDS